MDEYSAGGGGKLKLKGAKVSDGRVKKKKSSKKSSSAATAAGAGGAAEKEREKSSEAAAAGEEGSSTTTTTGALPGEEGEEGDGSSTPQSQSHAPAKTEAEKRHEEMRRKRVCCTHSTFPPKSAFWFVLLFGCDIGFEDVLLLNFFFFFF